MKKLVAVAVILGFGLALAETYVFQRAMDIGTLDPIEAGSNLSISVIENVYERLYGYEGASVELRPQLATAYEVSDDGLTHTFRLREGVRFHSGNPFTCADVEYSLKFSMIYFPDSMAEAVFGPDVAGAYEFDDDTPEEAYEDYWAKLDRSVECLDPLTVVVRVRDADPLLLARLSTYGYSIVDSAWAKENGMWDGTEVTWRDWIDEDHTEHHMHTHASGTGAYKIVSWEPGVRVTAERHADYWGATPQMETIIYEVVPAESDRVAALLAGEADQIDLNFEETTKEEFLANPGVRVYDPGTDPSLPWSLTSIWTILFNYDIDTENSIFTGSGRLDGLGIPSDFFTDRDVRKCFAYSFDPDTYNEALWHGDAVTLSMAVVPEYAAYDPDIPQYHLDREKAAEYCRAAWDGELWERGFYVTVPYPDGHPIFEEAAGQLRKNLNALNRKFAVDVQAISWDWFFEEADAFHLPLDVMGTPFTLPDAAGFMSTWYHSANSWPGYYGYENEEIDRLVEEVRTEFDQDKRAANYREVGRLGYEDAMFIMLPNGPYTITTRNSVTGAYRNPMLMEVRWQDLGRTR